VAGESRDRGRDVLPARDLPGDRQSVRRLPARGQRESGDVAARHRGPLARFPPVPVRSATTIDKRGGRVEKRRRRASAARNDSRDWPHLGPGFRIDRGITSPGETTHERAVGVTRWDAAEAPPEQLLQYVRGPWGIENRLHWVRDVTMGEDARPVRTNHAPEVMAALRNTTLG
jgi:hypothetical protein